MPLLAQFNLFNDKLSSLHNNKTIINTINAHCFNMTQSDVIYADALLKCEVLIPDGISVVWAMKFLTGKKLQKIAGADLFFYELNRLQITGGKCFFLGSTTDTLQKIEEKIKIEFPAVEVRTYSPPYKNEFSEADNILMLEVINTFQPDVLMVGMTAPKQEKWAYRHYQQLQVGHICCIGAVFDFYAGTIRRAPKWMINLGLEWLYRLIKEPRRMWKRYLVGNILFITNVIKEKLLS